MKAATISAGGDTIALAEKLEREIGMLPLSREARDALSKVALEVVVAAWMGGRDQGVRSMLHARTAE